MPFIDIDTKIPNTTMRQFINATGEAGIYEITPADGYVLHNNARDWTETDEATGQETICRGYSRSPSTVPASYDFENVTTIENYKAYGEKEIFARHESQTKQKLIF